jgi:hypothetical protein
VTTEEDTDTDEATMSWAPSFTVFTQTPDWILNNTDINDAAFRTWMTIASFASNKQRTAFPSARKLMELRNKGRSVIWHHIAQLEAAGLLRREARYRPNGGQTSSHYTLAWDQPLPPVRKTGPLPHPETRTLPRPKNRAESRPENRAPRTRTTPELDPLPPDAEIDHAAAEIDIPQGADAPRTPRSKRNGTRNTGTNPRATTKAAAQDTQMRRWAQNMYSASLSHEEFLEMVESERAAQLISDEQAAIAIEASAALNAATHT